VVSRYLVDGVVHTIASLDFLLLAIYGVEVSAVLWLLPLGTSPHGASPQGIRRQRRARFLVPVGALALLPLFVLFLNTDGPAISSEYMAVILTPFVVGITVHEAVLMVRAWHQRRGS
jgi:hypothetical protein